MNPSATTPSEQNVARQFDGFLAELPQLKRAHAGKWVVWFNGLQHVDDTEDAAERWALGHLPPETDFVLARAEDPKTVPLSGLAPFRLSR